VDNGIIGVLTALKGDTSLGVKSLLRLSPLRAKRLTFSSDSFRVESFKEEIFMFFIIDLTINKGIINNGMLQLQRTRRKPLYKGRLKERIILEQSKEIEQGNSSERVNSKMK